MKIIFCADGTWNGPGEPDSDRTANPATNVLKLYRALQGTVTPETENLVNEQERTLAGPDGAILQHAKYLHGVGDSSNPLVRLLGGSVGAGLIARIVRGYTFISRIWRPGDTIVIIGFSRGAYTARALAGLISNQGLMDSAALSKQDAYAAGAAIWYQYRQQTAHPTWLQRLEDLVGDLAGVFRPLPRLPALRRPAPIDCVAVWDTVGALGIPEYALTQDRLDPFQFADIILSPNVASGIHAVAVDEQRRDFTPTFWSADARITQMLFPGAHANVGGGEPTSELSDCALLWMCQKLVARGVLFSDGQPVAHPDPCGTGNQPWTTPPWTLLPRGPRAIPPGLELSDSLRARFACNGGVTAAPGLPHQPYNPPNLGGYGLIRPDPGPSVA